MRAAMMTITEIAGFVGAGLAGVAYVPQISRLRRTRCSAGISQLAFGMWLLASLLTTARAVAIHAGVFIVLGVTQIVATALIMLYATRYKDIPCPSPSASRVQRDDGHRNGHLGRTGKRVDSSTPVALPSPITDPQPLTSPSAAPCARCETSDVATPHRAQDLCPAFPRLREVRRQPMRPGSRRSWRISGLWRCARPVIHSCSRGYSALTASARLPMSGSGRAERRSEHPLCGSFVTEQ